MKKFEGVLIATDLDGTLLNSEGRVSEENRAAIEYFKSEGGLFTFATARALFNTKRISDVVAPNAPIVFLNGGGVYDQMKNELLWAQEIDRSAFGMVELVRARLDGFSVIYASANSAHCEDDSMAVRKYASKRGIPLINESLAQMTVPICKVIFAADGDGTVSRIAEILKEHPEYDRFNCKRIEEGVYQIFPKGLNKGDAFDRLIGFVGADRRKTVTVGDEEIDISMFKRSGVSVAVSNGIDKVREAANVVTVSNDEHALAKIIADIESGAIEL